MFGAAQGLPANGLIWRDLSNLRVPLELLSIHIHPPARVRPKPLNFLNELNVLRQALEMRPCAKNHRHGAPDVDALLQTQNAVMAAAGDAPQGQHSSNSG